MATLRGTRSDDILNGTNYNDVIYGRAGNDVIETGAGNDTVYGGRGSDTIVIGSGTNQLYGGSGADTFAVGAVAAGRSNLRDWQDGVDKIDLTDLGISSLDELTMSVSGAWTMIDTGRVDVAIQTSRLTSALSADDFIFAAGPPPEPEPTPGSTPTVDFINGRSPGDFDFVPEYGNLDQFSWDWFSGATSPYMDFILVPANFWSPAQPIGPMTVQANMDVMGSDTFDFESFETTTPTDFSIIAYNDGQIVGTQTFAGTGDRTPTTYETDDALFDTVDLVEFIGISDLDNLAFMI